MRDVLSTMTGPLTRPTGLLGPVFLEAMLSMGRFWHVGRITVTLPDGTRRVFGGTNPGPDASITIHNARVAQRTLLQGVTGFCESYLDGDWSTPDMLTLFDATLANGGVFRRMLAGRRWLGFIDRATHALRPNSKVGSRRNIQRHYDLGNAFYARWLDPSMTYSSAVYTSEDADLVMAQRAKYEALCQRLELSPGMRVLEIGCGWGGFAEHAAREHKVEVTAITISPAQHDFARQRIAAAGLADRVEIRLQDYRDVTGTYDRIASIEMFEAVGEAYWPMFFTAVRDRLTAGGRAAMQVITIADDLFEHYRRGADYIQRHIFPGGMLPSPSVFRRAAEAAGLKIDHAAGFAPDYARTLIEWNERFQAAWPDIAAMGFDARFKRMWEQYLLYCAAGFRAGTIDVLQVALRRA